MGASTSIGALAPESLPGLPRRFGTCTTRWGQAASLAPWADVRSGVCSGVAPRITLKVLFMHFSMGPGHQPSPLGGDISWVLSSTG